jgi:hypothetical protein
MNDYIRQVAFLLLKYSTSSDLLFLTITIAHYIVNMTDLEEQPAVTLPLTDIPADEIWTYQLRRPRTFNGTRFESLRFMEPNTRQIIKISFDPFRYKGRVIKNETEKALCMLEMLTLDALTIEDFYLLSGLDFIGLSKELGKVMGNDEAEADDLND